MYGTKKLGLSSYQKLLEINVKRQTYRTNGNSAFLVLKESRNSVDLLGFFKHVTRFPFGAQTAILLLMNCHRSCRTRTVS